MNLDYAAYVTPAGIGEGPIKIIRYPEDENHQQVTDFISTEGKKVIAQIKGGDNMPPPDWMKKRQWSHDLLTMCLETNKPVPRIETVLGQGLFGGERVRKEVKPRLPNSGRLCAPPPSMLPAGDLDQGPPSSVAPDLAARPSSSMTSTSAPAPSMPRLIPVKQEPVEPKSFLSLKRQHTKVIELDSPSPRPKKPCTLSISQDEPIPACGELPDECEDDA